MKLYRKSHKSPSPELYSLTRSRYWDFEAAANKDMTKADIWRPDTGFGGDGRREPSNPTADVRCVTNGPFSYFRPYWTDSSNACFYSQHCLKRQWLLANETDGTFQRNLFAEAYDTPAMNVVRSKTTFRTFAPALEGDAVSTLVITRL
jgi:hypothetical protein